MLSVKHIEKLPECSKHLHLLNYKMPFTFLVSVTLYLSDETPGSGMWTVAAGGELI